MLQIRSDFYLGEESFRAKYGAELGVSCEKRCLLIMARGRIELPTRGFSVRCSTN
jgi:hypothetical protein